MVKSKVCEEGVSGLPTHRTSKLHGRQDVWSLRRRMWMVSPSQPTILSMWNDTVTYLHLFRPKPWGLWMREQTDFCAVLPSFPLGGEAMEPAVPKGRAFCHRRETLKLWLSPYIGVPGPSGHVPLWKKEEILFWKMMKSFLSRGGKRLTLQQVNRYFQIRWDDIFPEVSIFRVAINPSPTQVPGLFAQKPLTTRNVIFIGCLSWYLWFWCSDL